MLAYFPGRRLETLRPLKLPMSRTRWVEGPELGGILGYVFGGPEFKPVKIGKKVPMNETQQVASPQSSMNRTSRGSGMQALFSSESPDTQLRGLIRSKSKSRRYVERPDSGYGSIRTTSDQTEKSLTEPTPSIPSDIQESLWQAESYGTRLELEALRLEMQELVAERERERQLELADRADLEKRQRRKEQEAKQLEAVRKAVEEERQALAKQREERAQRQKSRNERTFSTGGEAEKKESRTPKRRYNAVSGAESPLSPPQASNTEVVQPPTKDTIAGKTVRMADLDWGETPVKNHPPPPPAQVAQRPPAQDLPIPPAIERTLGARSAGAHPVPGQDPARSTPAPVLASAAVKAPANAQSNQKAPGMLSKHITPSRLPASRRQMLRDDSPQQPPPPAAQVQPKPQASISEAELFALLNSLNDQGVAGRPPNPPTQANVVETRNANKMREQASAPPPIPTRPIPVEDYGRQERERLDHEPRQQEAFPLDRLTQLVEGMAHGSASLQAGLSDDRRERQERDRREAEFRRVNVHVPGAWYSTRTLV